MADTLPEGALRVQGALDQLNSGLQVKMLPESTATAEEAARAVGVTVGQIGKSIVFADSGRAVVAVVPGDRKVSTSLLAEACGGKLVKPNADDVFAMTGFRIGGVSPFGLPGDALVVIDASLVAEPVIYVAAGHPRAVVRLSGGELRRLANGVVASVAG